MPSREKPVKIDMDFADAIRFLATPPTERVRRRGSEPAESGSTTSASGPEPAPAELENEYHPTLADFLLESQTHGDTSEGGEC